MTAPKEARLAQVAYLSFPFRMAEGGAAQSLRVAHIREQIEQVLFTSPGERVFRPEWGFGARRLVFEPNRSALWEVSRNRLLSALADALAGEVDPKTLEVEVGAPADAPERFVVRISYLLAAVRKQEQQDFVI